MINKNEYYRKYYEDNTERFKGYVKKYQQSEKGKKKIKEYQKEYSKRKDVQESRRRYYRERYGIQKRIAQTINRQIRSCILLYSQRGFLNLQEITIKKYEILYGIDLQKIIDHLKPLPKDMENYEIDHIIPLKEFDLSKKEEIKVAYSPKNLQLLTPKENKKKGSKLNSSPIYKQYCQRY